ncbi:hypothetical protein OIU91_06080 [Streptomyces sp. NBC_01456]|uniref:hypothetical protein n=1 Tax=unclassified Streptomyces TaxID=2593676 RepID=UPI002E350430|nr:MULTISPECIES: hypothetical protein [unclassified Streptomyces]
MPAKTETAWPEGVVNRYLTLAGAALADPNITVDVTDDGFAAECRGCQGGTRNSYAVAVTSWAATHAERCRQLPRPTA